MDTLAHETKRNVGNRRNPSARPASASRSASCDANALPARRQVPPYGERIQDFSVRPGTSLLEAAIFDGVCVSPSIPKKRMAIINSITFLSPVPYISNCCPTRQWKRTCTTRKNRELCTWGSRLCVISKNSSKTYAVGKRPNVLPSAPCTSKMHAASGTLRVLTRKGYRPLSWDTRGRRI